MWLGVEDARFAVVELHAQAKIREYMHVGHSRAGYVASH